MKDLFRKTDSVISPIILEGGERKIIEAKTVYNNFNTIMTSENFLRSVPNDHMDLDMMRYNLKGIFENRAEFLFNSSLEILIANLRSLEIFLEKKEEDKFTHSIYLEYNSSTIKTIKEQIPYLFDLIFYFNIDLNNYMSIATTAMHMTTILYNQLCIRIHENRKDKYAVQVFEAVNKIFDSFTQSIIDDILTLIQEAQNVYFPVGDKDKYFEGKSTNMIELTPNKIIEEDVMEEDKPLEHQDFLINKLNYF